MHLRRSLILCLCALAPATARAQPADAVGVRAQGMGGAFTAVAEDATATWWNPAGIAGGAYFNALFEVNRLQEPHADRGPAGEPLSAWRSGSGGFAVAFPALALSYYRIRTNEIGVTDEGAIGREDPGTGEVRLRSFVLSQFGVTVGQSIGQHLVVASTVKIARGTLATARVPASTASLDQASDLEGDGDMHTGLDVGAMAIFGHARLGLTVRNLREPTFDNGLDTVRLQRHLRAGVAWSTAANTKVGGVTAAADADLTTTTTVIGDERRVAAGFEAWTMRRTLGVRVGAGANTIGARRAAFSGGFSVAVRSSTYLDGAVTVGSDQSRRGWGGAMRVTF